MAVVMAYLVCAVVWGTTWFAIRVCIGEGGYPTIAGAATRFTVASLLLLLIVHFARIAPRIQSWQERRWLTVAGLFNGVGYAFVYLGEESVPGAFAAILFGVLPLLTAFFAIVSKTEKVTLGHLLGASTSLIGIAIIFWDRLSVSTNQAWGIGFICVGVIVSAIYSVILKRTCSNIHPIAATAWFLSVTAIALWCTAFIIGKASLPWPLPVKPTAALLYLAIAGSVITFASYIYLLQHVSLMTSTTLVFIQPLIALFIDSRWEKGIQLNASSYIGAAVTLGGVLVTLLWSRLKQARHTKAIKL